MKILMVNKFLYPKGGSETYMFSLAEKLSQMGNEVRFFGMMDGKNIVQSDRDFFVKNLDFHNKSLSTIFYPFKVVFSFEAYRKISKLIKAFKPDIVHLNNYNFQLTPSIIYAARRHGIPIVQTVHDAAVVCPAHSLYNFQKGEICEMCKEYKYINCIRTKCIHGSLAKSILGALEGSLYHMLKTYDLIDTFICPSRFIAEKISEFGNNSRKMEVLHNFVAYKKDPDEFKKKEYILYFGRISAEKGIMTLIKSAQKLPHIKFVIAGEGSLAEFVQPSDQIALVGFKSGQELQRLITESLFTVYPSDWYENCPMSILESHALGTPVIGANIGGIPELVQDNVNGLLFKQGDVDDLVKKISLLYNDRIKLSSLTNNCKQTIQKFSLEDYYKKIMKIYQDAINRK